MHEIKRKVKELKDRFMAFEKGFGLVDKKKHLEILESEINDPDFWHDQERARHLTQEQDVLKHEVKEVDSLSKEIQALVDLSEEGELTDDLAVDVAKLEKRLKKLELVVFLAGKYDQKNAFVSIHAGQGGIEAMDWVSMLFRMYVRFCERRKWKVVVTNESFGEEAGLKSVTFEVLGSYAYGYLKNESGTHRLVRQSPFNADNLRQTSFALVEILPEFEATDVTDIEIKDDDLEWQFFRASSQGGQNVQKVSSAVRLKHKPTGIVVTAQTERYQEQNRRYALNHLRAKLWAEKQEELMKEKEQVSGEYTPATWGTQIRSYVLHPYKMVKDLRTEVETADSEAVLDGDLDGFIEAELKLKS